MSLKQTYDAVKKSAQMKLNEELKEVRGEGLTADQKNAMFKAGCDAMEKLDAAKVSAILQTLNPELVIDGDLNKKKAALEMAVESALNDDNMEALSEVYASLAEAAEDEDLADLALALISEDTYEDDSSEDNRAENLSESLDAIFGSDMLTEDAREQVSVLFEAAVADKAIQLAERVAVKLEEDKEAEMMFILEQLDSYLDNVVDAFFEENSLAVEQGIRVEIMESVMDGFKTLVESHNLNVVVDDQNLVDELDGTVKSLQDKLDDVLHENSQLKRDHRSLIKASIVEQVGSSLTLVEREKLAKLAEEIEFKDADSFANKIELIAEHYFGEESDHEVLNEEDVRDPTSMLTEDRRQTNETVQPDIEAIASTISRTLKK